MFQSGLYWLILASSVVIFWLLPRHFRPAFVALVSFAYLVHVALLSAMMVLGLSLLAYLLAPLSIRITTTQPALVEASSNSGSGTTVIATLPEPSQAEETLGQRRWIIYLLAFAILLNLFIFKYRLPSPSGWMLSSAAASLAVPLGISYYSFKLIHYVVEVGRGKIANRSLWTFFSYIFLFPAFSSGPIERFDHFLTHQENNPRLQSIGEGLIRIAYGLIKKFVIAEWFYDYFSIANSTALPRLLMRMTTPQLWWLMIASYLYVYMDFSAYSDLAIGSCRLFGISLMENFDFPVLATNLSSFWKRWHMTLTGWCQSYVYMPVLAWARNPYVAVGTTFIAIGLWHAATWHWVMWGLYHAAGIVIFQKWSQFKRKRRWQFANHWSLRPVAVALTFLFVSAGMACTLDGIPKNHDLLRIAAKLSFINVKPDRETRRPANFRK